MLIQGISCYNVINRIPPYVTILIGKSPVIIVTIMAVLLNIILTGDEK